MGLTRTEKPNHLSNFSSHSPHKRFTAISSCLKALNVSLQSKNSMAGLWQDWSKLVGQKLAANCRPLRIQGGILIVGASHPQWRQALLYNKSQLIASIKTHGYKVKDIRIQQYHPEPSSNKENEKSTWARHPSRVDVHGLASCDFCGSPSPAGELALWGKCCFCKRKDLK